MKYFILLSVFVITFFLQSNGGFSAEDKVVRLIDLSPKEESIGTGLENISPSPDKSDKTKERKGESEKSMKDEKENDKSESANNDEGTGSRDEKENVQGLINSYILETYKAQGDKILKDMDISLQKKIPDITKRIQAYTSIQTTLELRKNRILKANISDVNKSLLSSYFDYMIDALEKKKENLKE